MDTTTTLLEVLARGLFALDQHQYGTAAGTDAEWASFRLHYRRDAERFLLGPVAAYLAVTG